MKKQGKSLQAQSEKRVDMYEVNPDIIQEEPGWNARVEGPELDAHIRFLADSIKSEGVKEPLTVYLNSDGVPVVTNGHCRLRAVKLAISEGAEIKTVPVRPEKKTANDADRVLSMITRNNGKPLAPIELSAVVKRLIEFGWSQKDIAVRTGFTAAYISQLTSLSGAPEAVKSMVSAGQVSATLATETVKKEGETQAVETLGKAVQDAESTGKKKATKKNVENVAPVKKVNWSKVGPELLRCLNGIVDEHEVCLSGVQWTPAMVEARAAIESAKPK